MNSAELLGLHDWYQKDCEKQQERKKTMEKLMKAQQLITLFKEAFANANSFGNTDDNIIQTLRRGDGIITPDFSFEVARKTILTMAAMDCFDGRNQAAVMRCRDICRKVFHEEPNTGVITRHERFYGDVVYAGDERVIMMAMERDGDTTTEDLFVTSIRREHRTLQQTFTRACIKLVFESGRYDFSALDDNEPWRLPLV